MPNKNKGSTAAIVLLSGGMDSVTALYHETAQRNVIATVSFDYGSKHNASELPCAAWHANQLAIRHIVIPLQDAFTNFHSALLKQGSPIPNGHYTDQSMQKTVIPFRNGIMLAVATGLAESLDARTLVLAAHAGDHAIYPDCRPDFVAAMARAATLGTYAHIDIHCPFIGWTKTQILVRGTELGIDYSRTWSCYRGGSLHCGACGTCVERREAFLLAKIQDPTDYRNEPALPAAPPDAVLC